MWQAWDNLTSTVVSRGRRGTDGTGWRAWTGLGARDAAALCVAGVAQTHIYCRFTWQAWQKLTSTVVLRSSRGTDGTWWRAWTGLGACDAAALCVAAVHKLTSTVVCVAGVEQMALGGALGRGLGACDAAALCVAGVVLPACFFVPRASACLILQCLSTFFCRLLRASVCLILA